MRQPTRSIARAPPLGEIASRIFLASPSGLNGFWRNGWFDSSTPWWPSAPSVNPDMNTTRAAGRSSRNFVIRPGPLTRGMITSVSTTSMIPACSAANSSASSARRATSTE